MNVTLDNSTRSHNRVILIVDDNPTNLAVVSDCLKDSGFKILVAQDGKSALKKAQYGHPDLVLLDVMMPGIDGFETCRRLKANEALRDIPVIFMTALTEAQDKVMGFKVGAVDYITKPFQHKEVLIRVTTHLRIQEQKERLQHQALALAQANEQLGRVNDELERRVEERTAELTQANADLKAEMAERVRAEEERELLLAQIREQAQQTQQIMNTVPEGVLLLDAQGRALLANPVAERDLAVLAEAQVGDILTHLGDHSLAELLTSPPTKGLWHEVAIDSRRFEVIARPVEDSPELESWVLVIRDVTQEREAREQLQRQERLAVVGQLAAGIAHDFNNIMAVIVLYTRMGLSTPDIPAKLRDRLEIVAQQAYKATDLIKQVLDFARQAVLERRPMDLTLFLNEVVKLLERTVPESIAIDLTHGRDEYTVNADPTRMQQAVMNLVINARDAMLPKGGGELRIALSRPAETDNIRCVTCGQIDGGEWVRIAVTDTGSGVPPDVLPHIFEPFFTTKGVGKGTGLGLAQVYGIVKQHEGHIDVTAKAGQGTTFTVYLPALLDHQLEAPSIGTHTFVQGQGETILVVEDDATLQEALVDSVELLNYRVLAAADGREALDILEQHAGDPLTGSGQRVALVLSDLVMPEMGGHALFHAMRQRGLTLPVVILSGHSMENELENLQAQGLAGWMLKPPSIEQLSQLLARALREESE